MGTCPRQPISAPGLPEIQVSRVSIIEEREVLGAHHFHLSVHRQVQTTGMAHQMQSRRQEDHVQNQKISAWLQNEEENQIGAGFARQCIEFSANHENILSWKNPDRKNLENIDKLAHFSWKEGVQFFHKFIEMAKE